MVWFYIMIAVEGLLAAAAAAAGFRCTTLPAVGLTRLFWQ
jgi:hypothetical protein